MVILSLILLFPFQKMLALGDPEYYHHFYDTKMLRSDIVMTSQHRNGQFCLKKADIEKIIDAADNPRDRLIIQLLYYCGLRRGELVAIQPADIDWGIGRLKVRGKGGKERLVPIPREVLQNLKFYLACTRRPYVFPAIRKRRAPLTDRAINRIVRDTAAAAGVESPNPRTAGVHPHMLRHSCARRLKESGLSLETIGQFLGHKNITMTLEHYGLPSVDDVMKDVSGVFT